MTKLQLKAMLIVNFYIHGIVHHEYIPKGKTVTGKVLYWRPKITTSKPLPYATSFAENICILQHDNALADFMFTVQ